MLSCLWKMYCHNRPQSLKCCQKQLAHLSPIYLFGGLLLVKNGQIWVSTSITQEPFKLWALQSVTVPEQSKQVLQLTFKLDKLSLNTGQVSAWCSLAIIASIHKSMSYTITPKKKKILSSPQTSLELNFTFQHICSFFATLEIFISEKSI